MKMARLAIETGVFVLFELENGKFRFTGRSKSLAEKGNRLPLVNYLERQDRFKKMSADQLSLLQKFVDNKWNEYLKKAESSS